MSELAEVSALAPAKVNLRLAVLGRRGDGYHELSTEMAALGLADRLRARRSASGEIALTVEGPAASADIPDDSRNLVWRAARAVLDRGIESRGVSPATGLELCLTKEIPSRAGLGGGSSDAAAAVVAVEKLLGLPPDPAWRRGILAPLGADCVFFHDVEGSGVALCEGVGERVTPIAGDPPPWTILLLTPALHCRTAEVFAALGGEREERRFSGTEPDGAFAPAWLTDAASRMRSRLASDLEPAALRAVPELLAWRRLLDETGAEHLRLTGSGSTFFGLYSTEGEAREALDRLRGRASGQHLPVRFHALTRIRAGGARVDSVR